MSLAIPKEVIDAEGVLHKWFEGGALSNPPDPPENTLLPPWIIQITLVTIFGRNWDGSDDVGDMRDGKDLRGAWGAETHNETIIGCVLPLRLLSDTFGGTEAAHIKGYTCGFYSHVTQKEVQGVDIVDIGPAPELHRLADGTFGLHAALGHLEYGKTRWGTDYRSWPAGFHCGLWINDPAGKAIAIKGVDFHGGRVLGS